MLSKEQREEFRLFGITKMPGAIPKEDAAQMCDCIWEALQNQGIRRDAPDTWNSRRLSGFHHLPESAKFEQIATPAICDALDDLLGSGKWRRPERWASLLVAFPESRERWDVPHQSWHLDLPATRAADDLFAMRLFTCVAELQHGGGATMVLGGSHRLVQKLVRENGIERMRSADVRRTLMRKHPWINGLCSLDTSVDRVREFMQNGTTIDGIELRVMEMTGEPGDVYLVHPLMMHAGSTNCASVPRLVLSTMVYCAGAFLEDIYMPRR